MKPLCLILLLVVAGLAAPAQTNAPPQKLTITSVAGGFDMKGSRAIYLGDVVVVHPSMKLTCEWLAANLPHDQNPDKHILATTNVIIDMVDDKNQKWHVTCDQAVYDYRLRGGVTNETVTVSGNARAQSDQVTVTGEPLVFDLATKLFTGTNYTTVFNRNFMNFNTTNAAGTNPPAAPTNSAAAPR